MLVWLGPKGRVAYPKNVRMSTAARPASPDMRLRASSSPHSRDLCIPTQEQGGCFAESLGTLWAVRLMKQP